MDAKDSCVFRRNWLDAAHSIKDPQMRCYFFEAIMQYAMDGMKMDVPPELELALGVIYSLIDIDRNKYERKIEKRREAGRLGAKATNQIRWGADSDNGQQMSAKSANADNGQQMSAKSAVTVTDTATETVTDTDTATVRNNVSINPPIAPKGASEAGAIDFREFYKRVREVPVPKAILDIGYEAQYVWRTLEGIPGYGVEISKAIARKGTPEQLREAVQNINQQVQPTTPFGAVKLALTIPRLKTKPQIDAVVEEATRSIGEPDIFKTLIDKAEYIIKGNKVQNLKAFMRARQP